MKLITFMQGTAPSCGLALSDTIGVDLQTADPSLPGNWHALLQDLGRVHEIHNQLSPRIGELAKSRLGGQPLPTPFMDLREIDLLTPIPLVGEFPLAITRSRFSFFMPTSPPDFAHRGCE